MKTIICILLVGLLSSLGCSGSDDVTSTTSTAVGEASPVTPFGIIDILDPSYQWTPVPGATRYRLLVHDRNETAVIDEWYTAEESGCESEEVLCTVNPGIVSVYENTWKIQACANQVCGQWSETLHYDVSPTPVSTETRFTYNADGSTTDNSTGLMWAHVDSIAMFTSWAEAISYCNDLVHASGHSDWRLPSLYAQVSFLRGIWKNSDEAYEPYWTTTERWGPEDPSMVWCVYPGNLATTYRLKDVSCCARAWPVRDYP
jgi:hypothetical protein